MAYVEIINSTTNSIIARLADMDTSYSADNRVCVWYLDGVQKATQNFSGGISEGANVTFSGLSSGTEYEITATVSANSWSRNFTTTATTEHITPSITSFSVAQTTEGEKKATFTWTASNLESSSTYSIEAQDSNGKWWPKKEGAAKSSASVTVSFDYFETYNVRLRIINDETHYALQSATVTLVGVSKWNWNRANSPQHYATGAQTIAAYNAVTGKGATTNFSYLVWNDMCAKVKEIRTFAGESEWNTTYGTYSSALMSSSDKRITAARFNNLKNQIASVIGISISNVAPGDKVLGSYFTTLTSRMNDWIDTL